MERATPVTVRLGISACLLGSEVRWDGGHKRDGFLVGTVGPLVTWVPVCPEVELGLGTPRETIHLRRAGEGLRLVGTRSGRDHTEAMEAFARRRVEELAALDLDGYVLKSKSPSCGLERLKVYDAEGRNALSKDGVGLFARALQERFPALPVEEDGRLNDPVLRETFFVRVFGGIRCKALFRPGWTRGELVAFHASEKLTLLAHDEEGLRELGRLVAAAKEFAPAELELRYRERHARALARPASVGRHLNVLQHVLGHFREALDEEDRRELLDALQAYQVGEVPLVVPITLLRHHARRQRVDWLRGQSYLEPHPRELMILNHV